MCGGHNSAHNNLEINKRYVSTNGGRTNGCSHAKKKIKTLTSHLSQKLTQMIIDLNLKWKTIKLLEHIIVRNLGDLGLGNGLIDIISKTWFMEEKYDKLNFIKIKKFCPVKDTIKRMKRQVTD